MTESSWSPKESAGPLDFFRHFSSCFHASTSSFSLASLVQNNPAACLAEWCGFFPESGVVFADQEGRLVFVGVCRKEQVTCRMVFNSAPACSSDICPLARSASWEWMFHRASSVYHLATTKAGARRQVALGKTGVSWGSCSSGMY